LLIDPRIDLGRGHTRLSLHPACAEDSVGEVLELFERRGFEGAAVIGNMIEGRGRVTVAV
jgi:hypothetical protein